jgi:hypothetical protein
VGGIFSVQGERERKREGEREREREREKMMEDLNERGERRGKREEAETEGERKKGKGGGEKRREEKASFTRGKFLKSSHFASRFSLLTSFNSTYCLRGTSLKRQSLTLGGMLTFGAKISIQARLSCESPYARHPFVVFGTRAMLESNRRPRRGSGCWRVRRARSAFPLDD